jgi:Ferric reductase like transmembrane component
VLHIATWWSFYPDAPVYQHLIPAPPQCWTWISPFAADDYTAGPLVPCWWSINNLTGVAATTFFVVLWGSSLHWVRRRNYRAFYLLHETFGLLLLLTAVAHVPYYLVFLIPGVASYLASTAPTLVQALASRLRGGSRILKVVAVTDSGGCVEIRLDAPRGRERRARPGAVPVRQALRPQDLARLAPLRRVPGMRPGRDARRHGPHLSCSVPSVPSAPSPRRWRSGSRAGSSAR